MVWGIASNDFLEGVTTFVDQMGLTFPILFDEEGATKANYNPGTNFTNSPYPQDWIIGVDGMVAYISNQYDPDTMISVIENELSKIP